MDKNAIETISRHYGYDAQSRQLAEECGELIVAVNKYYRKSKKPLKKPGDYLDLQSCIDNITEELSDTIIMINQIKHLLNISDKNIDKIIEQKICL